MNPTSTELVIQAISSTKAATGEILPSILYFALTIIIFFWIMGIVIQAWRYSIFKMSGIKRR